MWALELWPIAAYVVLSVALYVLLHKRTQELRTAVMVAFNMGYVLMLQMVFAGSTNFGAGIEGIVKLFENSIVDTMQHLTFNSDLVWNNGYSDLINIQISLIMIIAAVITLGSVVVAFFLRAFSQLAQRIGGFFRKEQYIIVGKSDDAIHLISDIKQNVRNPYIVYIPADDEETPDEFYKSYRIESKDFIYRLKKTKSKRKQYYVVLLPEKKFENLNLLQALNEAGQSCKIKATAFLENDIVRFHDIKTENIDACVMSVEQLMIYRLFEKDADGNSDGENVKVPFDILKENHCFDCSDKLPYLDKPFEICVIGFGVIGQEYLLHCYENSAFLTKDNKKSFRAVAIDYKMSVRKEQFLTNVPYFENSGHIEFVNAEINTEEFFDTLRRSIPTLSQIVISTENCEQNIQTALSINSFFNRIGVYKNQPEILVMLDDEYTGLISVLENCPNIRFINVNESVYRYSDVIERKIDELGKRINDQYNKSGNGKPWNKLGTFLQASNRAAARDKYVKRGLYQLCATYKYKDESLEFLAMYEHSRWMAFHYARGWQTLPATELTQNEKENCVSKRVSEKRHTCLVEWDELDKLPQKDPGLKSYDRDNVDLALKKDE